MHFYTSQALRKQSILLSISSEKKREDSIRQTYETRRRAKRVKVEREALEAYSSMELDPKLPKSHDFDGAVKGLVVIHNTYRFDLKQASLGNFEIVDWLNSDVKKYRVVESLAPSDWLTLAKRAITAFKFYDSAVDFVRQGLDTSSKGSKLMTKFQSLAKNLAHFNNEMLTKTGQVIGGNYSVTPNLLTPDLKVNSTPVGEKCCYTYEWIDPRLQ